MTSVRFATACDVCGARSEEYTEWQTCRDCLIDVCPTCAAPGSERDEDRQTGDGIDYEVTTVWCLDCAADHDDPRGLIAERERDEDSGLSGGYSDPRDERAERRGLR
jgi:hypothetical protein